MILIVQITPTADDNFLIRSNKNCFINNVLKLVHLISKMSGASEQERLFLAIFTIILTDR